MKFFSLIFVFSLALLLVQCTDPPVSPPIDESLTLFAGGRGGGNGGGGGGHTETQANNLSFPALLADGFSLSPVTESLTVPYAGAYEGLTQAEIDALIATGPWYAQKVEGNVWQGEYQTYTGTPVTFIDWGDAMESVDPKIRRPYRVEFGVYVELPTTMSAYTMALLAFPSSKDETQGTNGTRYDCGYATIASPLGKCVIQKYDPGATLTWNATLGQWDGAYGPETGFGFAQELNVGGKYIFGASTGGWKPTELGEYRITFYFDQGSAVNLTGAQPGDYNSGAPIIPKIGERNTAVVDGTNNLTYMDVTVVPGGGGGGGH
jgi:hypothetical protein